MKTVRAGKAPRLFPQAIGKRRFERSILRRIHVNVEREFLLGLYSPTAQGDYLRPAELSEDERKRLSGLARSIRANRGAVRTGKVLVLAVLVGAVIVFSLFFKNRLLEGALERGLEGVFGARAEVGGLDFRLLGGSVTFDRLEVADREAPFRNLFELGWTQVSLDTGALLKRRFVLDNVEARDLAWNTERATSGALESRGAREEGGKTAAEEEGAAGALERTASAALGRLDVQGLLAEEAAALESPGAVEAANREIRAVTARWTERVARSRQDVESLSAGVEALRGTDVRAIRSLPEAQALAGQLRELAPAVRSLQEELRALDGALEGDLDGVEALRRGVEQAIDADVAFLGSRLDLSGGGLKDLASSLASRALEQLLGRVYGYALRAGEYGLALAERKRQQRKDGALRRAGRDVAFPAEALPRFLLRRLSASVSTAGASAQEPNRTAGALEDLSSDPDLLGRPMRFSFSTEAGSRVVAAEGFLDTRTARTDSLGLELRADNQPFALSEGLDTLGLQGVDGTLHLRTTLALGRDGQMRGQGRIEIPKLSVRAAEAADLLGATVARTVSGLSTGTVEFRYVAEPDQSLRLELSSNLDALLARALSEQLTALRSEYGARLRAALDEQLRESLGENDRLYAVLKELEAAAGGNLAEAGAYQGVLAAKQKELEARLAELQQKATDTLRREAEKQLEGVTDQLQLPKINF